MRVLSTGAWAIVRLLAADSRPRRGAAAGDSLDGAGADGALEALMFGAAPDGAPVQSERKAASAAEAAAGSRNAHSQTTCTDQPAAVSAVSASASRARLRSILARQ